MERPSLTDRGPADVVMALALVHHLAISNNTPLEMIAEWFAKLGRSAVVEMVPKSDSQVKRLLATREDVFPDYTIEGFRAAFEQHFEVLKSTQIDQSDRVLFILKSRYF